MQLHKGPLTYTRFIASPQLDTAVVLASDFPSFKPIDPHGMAETSVAFCNPVDHDEPFYPTDEQRHLAVRIETLKVSPAVLRDKVAAEAKVRCREQMRQSLTKRELGVLKAEITQRLRHTTEPKTKIVHVYLDEFCVRIFATGATAMRVFDLLESTLNVVLNPLGPLTLADQVFGDRIDVSQTCEPASFHLGVPTALPTVGSDDPRRYLGREFLTWLWFRKSVEDVDLARIELVESMVLASGGAAAERVTVQDDSVDTCEEARTALSCGKKVERLRFELGTEQLTYTATLNKGLQLASVRMPNEQEADGIEAGVLNRMARLQDLEAAVEVLFEKFIRIRASEAWLGEMTAMCNWVQEG
jgi:hypothetical protein